MEENKVSASIIWDDIYRNGYRRVQSFKEVYENTSHLDDVIAWVSNPLNVVLNSFVTLDEAQSFVLRQAIRKALGDIHNDERTLSFILSGFGASPYDLFRMALILLGSLKDGSRLSGDAGESL